VDITYLFESGSLVDFKPAELCKLVQALFADSAKRSALLEKIG
jgi:centromere/kinetochore protein ZW10